jgi:hypothetical protein
MSRCGRRWPHAEGRDSKPSAPHGNAGGFRSGGATAPEGATAGNRPTHVARQALTYARPGSSLSALAPVVHHDASGIM